MQDRLASGFGGVQQVFRVHYSGKLTVSSSQTYANPTDLFEL